MQRLYKYPLTICLITLRTLHHGTAVCCVNAMSYTGAIFAMSYFRVRNSERAEVAVTAFIERMRSSD
jgi:hypothetical protein